jgi:hypothetical protein
MILRQKQFPWSVSSSCPSPSISSVDRTSKARTLIAWLGIWTQALRWCDGRYRNKPQSDCGRAHALTEYNNAHDSDAHWPYINLHNRKVYTTLTTELPKMIATTSSLPYGAAASGRAVAEIPASDEIQPE